eukprot:TRINITY_DN19715_c0_g1_i1.p2 TRINITY_DN19715_c0_g1~~TRINITY_DN19715_c0_g1_i1.p2  ORF type:complete len:182 (+),score=19.43 TRINITY_DN19715_c0_g1_i1:91-636(+)
MKCVRWLASRCRVRSARVDVEETFSSIFVTSVAENERDALGGCDSMNVAASPRARTSLTEDSASDETPPEPAHRFLEDEARQTSLVSGTHDQMDTNVDVSSGSRDQESPLEASTEIDPVTRTVDELPLALTRLELPNLMTQHVYSSSDTTATTLSFATWSTWDGQVLCSSSDDEEIWRHDP